MNDSRNRHAKDPSDGKDQRPTCKPSPGLHQSELAEATKRASQVATSLRNGYPTLKPYLVIAKNGEYVNADSPLTSMLKEAPAIFVDHPSKDKVMRHLSQKPPRELLGKENEKKLDQWMVEWREVLAELSTDLRLRSDSLFEIRFGHLHYKEIWRMQTDERVDASMTPRCRASIRIVLGSVAEFAFGDVKCT